jgi:hypothetical protein
VGIPPISRGNGFCEDSSPFKGEVRRGMGLVVLNGPTARVRVALAADLSPIRASPFTRKSDPNDLTIRAVTCTVAPGGMESGRSALSMAARIPPLLSSWPAAIPPNCAITSINRIGENRPAAETRTMPVAAHPGSRAIIRSIKRNGWRCGRYAAGSWLNRVASRELDRM